MSNGYSPLLYNVEGGFYYCKEELNYIRHCPCCGEPLSQDIRMEDVGLVCWAVYRTNGKRPDQEAELQRRCDEFDLIGVDYKIMPHEQFDDSVILYAEKNCIKNKIDPWKAEQMLKIMSIVEQIIPGIAGETV